MTDLKGEAVIGDNPRGGNIARVVNGRLLVRFVTRIPPGREGYGSAQIKGGLASHGNAVVVNGALRVRLD